MIRALSRQRMRRARSLVTKVAGAFIHHRSTKYETLAPERLPEREEAHGDGEPMPPGVHRQLLDDLYQRWLDEPVPALGGITPRQAAARPKGRAQVIELLRQYENAEARRSLREGTPPYDFTWLAEELGLDL